MLLNLSQLKSASKESKYGKSAWDIWEALCGGESYVAEAF